MHLIYTKMYSLWGNFEFFFFVYSTEQGNRMDKNNEIYT
jgi:hypothetical protein